MTVHQTAVLSPDVLVDAGAEIGPFCVIGAGVKIGAGTTLGPNVVIESGTVIGRNNKIFSGAVIGGEPQDKTFNGKSAGVVVGDNNVIRECVTINRSTNEQMPTTLGDHNYLMAYSHMGHDCRIGNHAVIVNAVMLGGHTVLEDYVTIGGIVGVHQFCRIGRFSMSGGQSRIGEDVVPFCMCGSYPAGVIGVNTVGMERAGFSTEKVRAIRKAIRGLFFTKKPFKEALAALEASDAVREHEEVKCIVDFIRTSKRGIIGRRKAE